MLLRKVKPLFLSPAPVPALQALVLSHCWFNELFAELKSMTTVIDRLVWGGSDLYLKLASMIQSDQPLNQDSNALFFSPRAQPEDFSFVVRSCVFCGRYDDLITSVSSPAGD